MTSLKHTSIFFAAALTACVQAVPEVQVELEAEAADEVLTPSAIVSNEGGEKAESPLVVPEQKESPAVQMTIITLQAQYMLANYSPRYATLFMQCNSPGTISLSVFESAAPQKANSGVSFVHESGEVNFYSQPFWQAYFVYFDEELVTFPPKYETRTKQVSVSGKFETRSERILITPDKDIYDLLLAKLKASQRMRLVKPSGIGPTFDINSFKDDIEILEASCDQTDEK